MTHRIDIAKTNATIVGGGIAGLATAAYLLRDGRVTGDKIRVMVSSAWCGQKCGSRRSGRGPPP